MAKLEETRVVKTMSPTQPGALKLAQLHGDALVCVRYRHDAQGRRRYTTVELVVEIVPVRTKSTAADLEIVGVKVDYNEKELQSVVRKNGATWDRQAKVWRMPRKVAKELGLLKRGAAE